MTKVYFLIILFFLSTSLVAKNIDTNPHTIYFKMSPNNEFKAAFSYDEYKQWYAFTIYEVKDKKDKLILISKIDDSFIENVIFKFTVDSNYLFYATQRHGYYEVYIFNERRTYECLGVFDLKNTKKKLMKNCVLE